MNFQHHYFGLQCHMILQKSDLVIKKLSYYYQCLTMMLFSVFFDEQIFYLLTPNILTVVYMLVVDMSLYFSLLIVLVYMQFMKGRCFILLNAKAFRKLMTELVIFK